MPLGAIISAGASLAGGLLGKSGADKDRKSQKEFAQKGIQWKVKDAEQAGVHPLFALGAPTTSFSPVGVGGADTAISRAGQDIGRAVAATSTDATKANAYTAAVQNLTLKRMGLENDLLASKIATMTQAGQPPSPPAWGQPIGPAGNGITPGPALTGGNPFGLIEDMSQRRTVSDPNFAWQEPGAINEVGLAKTASGGYAPVMSNDVKQRLEEDWPGMLWWNVRNRVLPTVGYGNSEPPEKARPGYAWVFNPVKGEYVQRRVIFGKLTW